MQDSKFVTQNTRAALTLYNSDEAVEHYRALLKSRGLAPDTDSLAHHILSSLEIGTRNAMRMVEARMMYLEAALVHLASRTDAVLTAGAELPVGPLFDSILALRNEAMYVSNTGWEASSRFAMDMLSSLVRISPEYLRGQTDIDYEFMFAEFCEEFKGRPAHPIRVWMLNQDIQVSYLNTPSNYERAADRASITMATTVAYIRWAQAEWKRVRARLFELQAKYPIPTYAVTEQISQLVAGND